jgi:hypothetical protein
VPLRVRGSRWHGWAATIRVPPRPPPSYCAVPVPLPPPIARVACVPWRPSYMYKAMHDQRRTHNCPGLSTVHTRLPFIGAHGHRSIKKHTVRAEQGGRELRDGRRTAQLLARPPDRSSPFRPPARASMGAALLASWPWDNLGFYKVRTC